MPGVIERQTRRCLDRITRVALDECEQTDANRHHGDRDDNAGAHPASAPAPPSPDRNTIDRRGSDRWSGDHRRTELIEFVDQHVSPPRRQPVHVDHTVESRDGPELLCGDRLRLGSAGAPDRERRRRR